MTRSSGQGLYDPAFTHEEDSVPDKERVKAFHHRQQEDIKRFERDFTTSALRQRVLADGNSHHKGLDYEPPASKDATGIGGWRDSEGDRLDDFGVDEDTELFNDDEIPLARLIRRR